MSNFDPLPEIINIVRDAITDGLLTGETVERFDETVKRLHGVELEDYIQELWDKI